ncbi:YjjG family noncanonical pyrimidine nucleotidase [bacterium]|nr:YjjG family noncanonical pyrimidine nucleotidase [bacterium]
MKIKAIFFDLDDTLLDHSFAELQAQKEIFRLYKPIFNGVSFENYHETYVKHNSKLWELITQEKITKTYLRLHRIKDTLEELNLNSEKSMEISDNYIEIYSRNFSLSEGTVEILEHFKNQFPLGIITNGFGEIQVQKLEKTGLKKYFQTVICSENVGKMKPHPLIFETATKSLNILPNEAIYVGDNYNADIIGGKNFGMQTVFYNPKGKIIENSVADLEIANFSELKKFFGSN